MGCHFLQFKIPIKNGPVSHPGGGSPPSGGVPGGGKLVPIARGRGGVPPLGGVPRGLNMAKKGPKMVIFSGFEPNFAQNRSHLCSI